MLRTRVCVCVRACACVRACVRACVQAGGRAGRRVFTVSVEVGITSVENPEFY